MLSEASEESSKFLSWVPEDLRVLLKPKFLFPSIVVLIFSAAALNLTVRLLDQEESALSHSLERSVALLDTEDMHRHYEMAVNRYLADAKPHSLDKAVERFKSYRATLDAFAQAQWQGMDKAQPKALLMGIQDDSIYLDYLMQKRNETSSKAFSRKLQEKNQAIHERFEKLKDIFLTRNKENISSRALHARHDQILWSVFIMGLSGFVLIVFLVDRLASLERIDHERHHALGLAEQRVASMEAARDGMMITAANGEVTYANRAVLQNYRLSEDQTPVGRRWAGLYAPDQIAEFKNTIVPEVEGRGLWSGQVVALRHDGTIFPQDLSITRLADGGAIWVMRDITGQMESERLSQRRLAAIEAAGDGIGMAGSDGKLSYMNQALMRLHGIAPEDRAIYLGESWEFLHSGKGGERIPESVRHALSEEGYWKGETRITRRDGGQTWAEMTMTILPDGGVVCTASDISGRKKAEAEKEDLREQVFQAQKMEAIGRLAGGIAHDFNNILAAIMGYAEFLVDDLENDPDKKKFAEGVVQAGSQGRHLVDQMLAFSRRRETTRDVMDIRKPIEETVSILRASLPKTIEVQTDFEMDRAMVKANATQIAQAVMNLCVNGRDAMEDEHGTLSVALSFVDADEDLYGDMIADSLPDRDAIPPIRIHEVEPGHSCLELGTLARGKQYVQLSVSDTGTGMSYAVMQHIFEPFFTTKPVDKGTGLGLANVHGVVVAHQGALVVDSTLGEGTRFELFFPLAAACENSQETPQAGVAAAVPGGSGRILIVEDQEQVRQMMVTMLARMGHETHTCDSGLEALYHLRGNRNTYDLVVTDHNMPKMTGIELADQIAIEIPDLPFILVTGYSKESLESDMSEHTSIKAVLRKPVDRKELGQKIQDVLKRSSARGVGRIARTA